MLSLVQSLWFFRFASRTMSLLLRKWNHTLGSGREGSCWVLLGLSSWFTELSWNDLLLWYPASDLVTDPWNYLLSNLPDCCHNQVNCEWTTSFWLCCSEVACDCHKGESLQIYHIVSWLGKVMEHMVDRQHWLRVPSRRYQTTKWSAANDICFESS